MNLNRFNIFIPLTCFLILFSACKKPEPGPPGKDGRDGRDGKDGKDGGINIITRTHNTINGNWFYNDIENSYDVVLVIPEITAAVVNEGTIQVFFDLGGTTPNWAAMPFAYGDLQYNYDYLIGIVNIYVTLGSNAVPENPGGVRFKIVIIPPASKSKEGDTFSGFEKQEIIVAVP